MEIGGGRGLWGHDGVMMVRGREELGDNMVRYLS